MPLDYAIMLIIGVIGTVGGLLTLREAKKYRARRDSKSVNQAGSNR